MQLLNDAIQGQIEAAERQSSEYALTAYVVGFGDGVRSWVTGEGGEDAALEEARSWHADQAYIDAWRAGREWAKGRRG
jgi:hypothetical protein